MSEHSVIIIGSGPAGYTAAIYTARAGLEPIVLEGALTAGGALMNTSEVENFPGFPEGIQGPDLMAAMKAQAERFGTSFVTDDVTGVELAGAVKEVTDSDGNSYVAPAVILATGSAYRELGLADEARLTGHGVSYCATCDGFFYRDQEVAVIGGGESALEEAQFLSRFASRVHLIHRRDRLRASRISVDRAEANPKISFHWNQQVSAIRGALAVSGLELTDTVSAAVTELPLQGVFVAIGHRPRSELFADQVTIDQAGYVVVNEPTTQTNLAGVFACGDLVDHSYRQAITAAASGCRAALDAERWLAAHTD